MRFEFYHEDLDAVPKLSVDGTVPNSIHLSHWAGNQTPEALRADTSTEIALNLLGSTNPATFTNGIELVTNNHFDTDGVLSVWTVLTGNRALDLRAQLIAAAEAGDFSEFHNENAVRASIVIQGADQAGGNNDTVSPLAQQLALGGELDDARCYELVLPEVENVLTRPDRYEPLWRDAWTQVERSLVSFETGKSSVTEYQDSRLSLVELSPDVFGTDGFDPMKHVAPFTAISRYARGHLFLITTQLDRGWSYRIDYPYYSWAETVVRPRIERIDFGPVLSELNHLEPVGGGTWKRDQREMTSAVKFLDSEGVLAQSRVSPGRVAEVVSAHMTKQNEVAAATPRA